MAVQEFLSLYSGVHYLEDYQYLTSLESKSPSRCCGHVPFVKAQKLGEIVGSFFKAIEEVGESGRVFF